MPSVDLLDFTAASRQRAEWLDGISRMVTISCGLTPVEAARLIGAKQCLSCGAYQNINGDLPCNH